MRQGSLPARMPAASPGVNPLAVLGAVHEVIRATASMLSVYERILSVEVEDRRHMRDHAERLAAMYISLAESRDRREHERESLRRKVVPLREASESYNAMMTLSLRAILDERVDPAMREWLRESNRTLAESKVALDAALVKLVTA